MYLFYQKFTSYFISNVNNMFSNIFLLQLHNFLYMTTQQNLTNLISQSEFLKMSMSSKSPKKKYKLNIFDNTLSPDLEYLNNQQQKLKQYVEQELKDTDRYCSVKQKLKQKFFSIKNPRRPRLQKPASVLETSMVFDDIKCNQQSPQITSARRYKLSSTKQIQNQLNKVLKASQQLGSKYKLQRKLKVKSKSDVDNRHRESVDKQKNLIMKFIKKRSEKDLSERKWEDLTARQKYQMRFNDYVYKKTKSAIEGEIYERKIKKKNSKMEEFQNFIIQEVNFQNNHKEKLSNFFKKIRWQFKRVQSNHKNRNDQFKKQTFHTKGRKKLY